MCPLEREAKDKPRGNLVDADEEREITYSKYLISDPQINIEKVDSIAKDLGTNAVFFLDLTFIDIVNRNSRWQVFDPVRYEMGILKFVKNVILDRVL